MGTRHPFIFIQLGLPGVQYRRAPTLLQHQFIWDSTTLRPINTGNVVITKQHK